MNKLKILISLFLAILILLGGSEFGFLAERASAASANLALNKTITASSSSFPATLANDGVVGQNSYWEGIKNAYPSTLTVDLGSSQSVNKAVIKLPTGWGSRTQTFSILGSNDDVTYTALAGSTTYLFDPAASNIVTVTFAPAAARYVRLNFTANSGANNGQVSELEVYGDATSLALNTPITSNGSTVPGSDFSATKANDGVVDQNSYWEGANNAYPNILTVDLKAAYSVNSLVVKLPAAWESRTQTFSVLGSKDNTTFKSILSSATYTFDPSSSNIVNVTFAPTVARYIQLNFTDNSVSTAAQVSELEVYGTANYVPPTPPQEYIIDFNADKGPINKKLLGGLLIPNYDVPDSRIKMTGMTHIRESIDPQTFGAAKESHGPDTELFSLEYSLLARSKSAVQRLKDLDMNLYLLGGYTPSWLSPNGGAMSEPNNWPLWKQYNKDVAQYYKDNDIVPEIWDIGNEWFQGYAMGNIYKYAWPGVKDIFPDMTMVGPSAYWSDAANESNYSTAANNGQTINYATWHDFPAANSSMTPEEVTQKVNLVQGYLDKYPSLEGKGAIIEEWGDNPGTTAPNIVRMFNAFLVGGVKMASKAIWVNSNDLDELLVLDKNSQNSARRNREWWTFYAYSKLSGDRVNVSQVTSNVMAIATKDTSAGEAQILISNAGNSTSTATLQLKNNPFAGQATRIDKYKIASSIAENDGLAFDSTANSSSDINFDVDVTLGAGEVWLLVLKKTDSAPGFFHAKTPDDGEVAVPTPVLTWSQAQGAATYHVLISENKDMSNPVVNASGVTGTSYQVTTPLTIDKRYYWNVTAVNANGSTVASNGSNYSFLVGSNVTVPGIFSLYLPSDGTTNEAVTPKFRWSKAYNAASYTLVVADNPDFNNPVINQSGITSLCNTQVFGTNSAVCYQPTVPLNHSTTYYWKAYAVNANGSRLMNGPAYNTFTTKAPGNSPVSFNLSSPANNATNVSLRGVFEWENSPNAFFYTLTVATDSDFKNVVLTRDHILNHKYTLSKNELQPNTTYYWKVTAYTKDLAYSTNASNNGLSFTTGEISLVLNGIKAPAAITVEGATAKTAEALGLPKTVKLALIDGYEVDANVAWNVEASSYDPSQKNTKQTFNVTGTVTLPTGFLNPNNLPLTTSVSVTVNPFGKVEAENYAAMSGIQTENSSEGTKNVGWTDAGDWMDYVINVPSTGTYKVNYRVSVGSNNPGKIEFLVDGVSNKITSLPPTGGWQNWKTVSDEVSLSAGKHTIRLRVETGGWNLNWFELVKEKETDKKLNSITSPVAVTGVANGTAKTATALGLPQTVKMDTDGGSVDASVTWNVEASSYDTSQKTQQIFTVSGTVTLPAGVVNPNNVPLTTSIQVTVLQASTMPQSTLIGAHQAAPGQTFDVTMGLSGVSESVYQQMYAQDLTLHYDPANVKFDSVTSLKDGFKIIDQKETVPGQIRIVAASVGANQGVPAQGDLLKFKFIVNSDTQANDTTVSVSNVIIANGEGNELQVGGVSHKLQISIAVDKSLLNTLIANAQVKHDAAVEGNEHGLYAKGSKSQLQAAIDAAKATTNDPNATQQQVDSAKAALEAAVQVFEAKKISADVNGKDGVTVGDLAIVAAAYGKQDGQPGWNAKADVNHDGKVDIEDLAIVAKAILQ
ncbi:discoidin domain-containing protein [Paenibacillus sp. GCM10027629]|uniref:galactose-binding domain-containing protein n=1 Tax=Paenibacillus sp. GCM10027629 TaxID=3273414 RepID=UPI00363BD15C